MVVVYGFYSKFRHHLYAPSSEVVSPTVRLTLWLAVTSDEIFSNRRFDTICVEHLQECLYCTQKIRLTTVEIVSSRSFDTICVGIFRSVFPGSQLHTLTCSGRVKSFLLDVSTPSVWGIFRSGLSAVNSKLRLEVTTVEIFSTRRFDAISARMFLLK